MSARETLMLVLIAHVESPWLSKSGRTQEPYTQFSSSFSLQLKRERRRELSVGATLTEDFWSAMDFPHVLSERTTRSFSRPRATASMFCSRLHELYRGHRSPRVRGSEVCPSVSLPSLVLSAAITNDNRDDVAFTTVTLPSEVLQNILLFITPSNGRALRSLPEDFFNRLSLLRSTSKAFYFAMLDMWPSLQNAFFHLLFKRLCKESHKVTSVMTHIDPCFTHLQKNVKYKPPSILDLHTEDHTEARRVIAMVDNFMPAIHARVNLVLRIISIPYLLVMLQNEVASYKATPAEDDSFGVPTLTGFARFLNPHGVFDNWLSRVQRRLRDTKRKHAGEAVSFDEVYMTIELFFIKDAPKWNMLAVDTEILSLDVYFAMKFSDLQQHNVTITSSCAMTDDQCFMNTYLFSEFQDGEDYRDLLIAYERVCASAQQFEALVTSCTFTRSGKKYNVVGNLTLPLRVMRTRVDDVRTSLCSVMDVLDYNDEWAPYGVGLKHLQSNGATWMNNSNCITLSVTTEMLRHVIQSEEMADCTSDTLPPGGGLDAQNFTVITEVLTRGCCYESTLGDLLEVGIFKNFMLACRLISFEVCDWGYNSHLGTASFKRHTKIDTIFQSGPESWQMSPFHMDWGGTFVLENDDLHIDPELMRLACNDKSSLNMGWAPNFCFDLRFLFECDNGDLWPWYNRLQVDHNGVSCTILETTFRASDLRHVTSNKDMCWSRHTFEHGLLQMKKTQDCRKEFERLIKEIRINFQERRGREENLLLYNRWLQISENMVATGIISRSKVDNIREILARHQPRGTNGRQKRRSKVQKLK